MNKKIKILYFVDRMLRGGIQSLVIEIVKNINKENFQIDFLLLDDGKTYDLEEKLKEMNCNVYKLKNVWINTPFDYLKYCKEMNKFFKTIGKEYDIVHLHSSSKNFMVLYYAKKYGVKIRIAHSHSTDFQTKNFIKKFVGNQFKSLLKKNATDYMACSRDAGKWLFGNENNVIILKNAINIQKFYFDEEKRKEIRNKYGIKNNEIVCGNVGRITEQKNHIFLINVFKKLYSYNKNYKLLLVGKGEETIEKELEKVVKENNMTDNVVFAGFQEKTYEYLNAMDLFVFPSKFEGLGIVLIEAQANGLSCIVSDKIPSEAIINSNVKIVSLDKEDEWVKVIQETNCTRVIDNVKIKDAGYDILEEIKKLEKFYRKRVKDEE